MAALPEQLQPPHSRRQTDMLKKSMFVRSFVLSVLEATDGRQLHSSYHDSTAKISLLCLTFAKIAVK